MDTNHKHFKTPFGTYQLQRFPLQKKQSLRAWDSADEYVLNHLHKENVLTENSRLLIINDQFGALATSLNAYTSEIWSDSYLSQLSSQHNFQLNQLEFVHSFIPSTEMPKGLFDIVLIKIPKTNALLKDQLIKLKCHIHTKTLIIATAMSRNIHASALALFEKILGTTTTSLAKKKARLIFTQYNNNDENITAPLPKDYHVKSLGIHLSNHANVFSKDKLDYGSLLMLEQFKKLPSAQHIVDLGCGNGVLGIIAQRFQPKSKLSFLDESYMAVASAKINYEKIYKSSAQSEFIVSDCLNQLTDHHTVDLILCNPPFHQQHTVGDQIAWRMFMQSAKHLKKGGQLWVVGNRHLQYGAKLKKIFGNSHIIAANKKFQVVVACL
jgi:16S rRNA (guanine1207-N2)-methyltransferase